MLIGEIRGPRLWLPTESINSPQNEQRSVVLHPRNELVSAVFHEIAYEKYGAVNRGLRGSNPSSSVPSEKSAVLFPLPFSHFYPLLFRALPCVPWFDSLLDS